MAVLANALAQEIQALSQDDLRQFLLQTRWFPKTCADGAIRLHNWAPLGPQTMWVLLQCEGGLENEYFQLPLAVADAATVDPRSVVRALGSGNVICDGLHHAPSRERLVQALRQNETWHGPRGAWQAATLDTQWSTGSLPARLHAGEQSNTSVLLGERAMLKVFRRLQPGPNPDLEMSAYLSIEQGCTFVPPVYGWLRYTDASGELYDAAALTGFVRQGADGWQHLVDTLSHAAGTSLTAEALPWAAECRTLGQTTAAMHAALFAATDPEFNPIPATPAHASTWAAGCEAAAKAALDLLAQRHSSLSPDTARLASSFLQRRDTLLALPKRLLQNVGQDLGVLMRHHGDYHLGQVLRTPQGAFVILDFEGEPLRPLAERRQRHCPLRDVAGMLRSFAYGAATLSQQQPEHAQWASRWLTHACDIYLQGYTSTATPWLPDSPVARQTLLDVFVAEKAWYEVRYELLHRPNWVDIPLAGLCQIAGM